MYNESQARIVRIATHPELQRMGYGKRALEQMVAYYQGEIVSLREDDDEEEKDDEEASGGDKADGESTLRTERLRCAALAAPIRFT